MKFTKMQGAGNDFILVETAEENGEWSETAIAACDRHYGIGADGLLLMMPSDIAHFRMRIFNADGSESAICGNGLRCMISYYLEHYAGNSDDVLTVETLAGLRQADLERQENRIRIKTRMGKPKFEEQDIPVTSGRSAAAKGELRVSTANILGNEISLYLVSMGNPHAVCFIDSPVNEYPLSDIGPEIASSGLFPEGVNYEVVRLLKPGRIEARVFERGVGETLACGSGACAITVAAKMLGKIKQTADILLPGGTLNVQWDGIGEVLLSGPVETVFTGDWSGPGVTS